MRCLIFQPNDCAIELSLPRRAVGQDCLLKVCDRLDIIETDYFGLQYERNGSMYWLNLRNPIRQQISQRVVRLYLRVKFFIPPHMIQQSSTRHQFFLCILLSLQMKKIKVPSRQQTKLIALIAQAKIGNYCDDSFDLKRLYSKWILCFQSGRREPTSPNSFILSVIFPFLKNTNPQQHTDGEENLTRVHSEMFTDIVRWHRQLDNYLPSSAESDFLKEMYKLEDYGMEFFAGRVKRKRCRIGIGSNGVTISAKSKKLNIAYASLQEIEYSVSNHILNNHYVFSLKYFNGVGVEELQKFKIVSKRKAKALYRILTEKYLFFSCSSVSDSVITRATSNFSLVNSMVSSIAPSLFKRDVTQQFIFDVQRTLSQCYDDIRRKIYHLNDDLTTRLELENIKTSLETDQSEISIQSEERLTCKICFDRPLNMAFFPCGHTSCEECSSQMGFYLCPFCKRQIENRQKIFV